MDRVATPTKERYALADTLLAMSFRTSRIDLNEVTWCRSPGQDSHLGFSTSSVTTFPR